VSDVCCFLGVDMNERDMHLQVSFDSFLSFPPHLFPSTYVHPPDKSYDETVRQRTDE